jgi:hypothetical protein
VPQVLVGAPLDDRAHPVELALVLLDQFCIDRHSAIMPLAPRPVLEPNLGTSVAAEAP